MIDTPEQPRVFAPWQGGSLRVLWFVALGFAATALIGGWVGHNPRWWWFLGILVGLLATAQVLAGDDRRSQRRKALWLVVAVAVVATLLAARVGNKPTVGYRPSEATSVAAAASVGDRSIRSDRAGTVTLNAGSGDKRLDEQGWPVLVPEGPIAALVVRDDEQTGSRMIVAYRPDGTRAWGSRGARVLAADDKGVVVIADDLDRQKLTTFDAGGKVLRTETVGVALVDDGNIKAPEHVAPAMLAIKRTEDAEDVDVVAPDGKEIGYISHMGGTFDVAVVGDRVLWTGPSTACRIRMWQPDTELDAVVAPTCFNTAIVRADGRALYVNASGEVQRLDLDTGKTSVFRASAKGTYVATTEGLVSWTGSAVALVDPSDGVNEWRRSIPSLRSIEVDSVNGWLIANAEPARPGPFGGTRFETRRLDPATGRDL